MYTVKVCDRFNTIQWETEELPTTEECQKVYDVLAKMTIKEEQPTFTKKKTVTTVVEGKPALATEPQKDLMRRKHIPFDERTCTKAQAQKLLMEATNVIPDPKA